MHESSRLRAYFKCLVSSELFNKDFTSSLLALNARRDVLVESLAYLTHVRSRRCYGR